MPELVFARLLHVLGVVLWIGGVAFVTTVLLPATRRLKTPAERIEFFETVELGFARQARITTVITGLSGLYMVYKLNLWQRFLHIEFWWMDAMVLVWLLFTLMLFVLEPLFLHRYFIERARTHPDRVFKLDSNALVTAYPESAYHRRGRGRQSRLPVICQINASLA